MGRKKKAEEDKAVAKSITFSRPVFTELNHKVKSKRLNYSKVINNDMTWYWELMSLTGLRLEGRFSIGEIKAILSVSEKIEVEIGQIAKLKSAFSYLFLSSSLDPRGLLSRDEIDMIENNFRISGSQLRKKLVGLTHEETIWLYDNLQTVLKNGEENIDEILTFKFRCEEWEL